ncbi:MAG: hypothetical protein H6718_27150 [Polyangiaceae bacterium]|nr:hypothetical protein [Myxococcales bacterium]MCB9589121.1 hypothetical protein [Polyangiaceae bacterium]
MQSEQAEFQDRPPRNVWIRPVCLALIAALLPLDWKRVEYGACNGQPGTVYVKSGWELLAGPPIWLLLGLGVLTLFLLWRSVRIDPAWRLFPATLGLLANLAAGFIVFMAATFEILAKPRILWAGFVVLSSAATLVVEGLVRFFAEIACLVRRRRHAKQQAAPPT